MAICIQLSFLPEGCGPTDILALGLEVSPEESVVALLKAWGQHSLEVCPPSFLHFLQGFLWSLSDRTYLIPNPSGSVLRPFCVHFFFFRVMLLRDGVHYDRLCLDEDFFMGTNFLKKFTTRSFLYLFSTYRSSGLLNTAPICFEPQLDGFGALHSFAQTVSAVFSQSSISTTSMSRCMAVMISLPLSFQSLCIIPEYASGRNSPDFMSSINFVYVISMTSGLTYSFEYPNWTHLFRALPQLITQTLRL